MRSWTEWDAMTAAERRLDKFEIVVYVVCIVVLAVALVVNG